MNQKVTPTLQPRPDVAGQPIVYVAFPDNDTHLSHLVGPARKLLGAEVAYAFSHGLSGVRPVLVVVSASEPSLPDVTFHRAE